MTKNKVKESFQDWETKVVIKVKVTVECPDGIAADERVMRSAAERAIDYVLDEGLENE